LKKSCMIFYVIFLLTIMDLVFTVTGLQLGIIEEANPIMRYFLNLSMSFSILCVLLFVGAILIFLYKASHKLHWLHAALTALVGIKVYVLLLHLRWISIYLR
jgi:hypothetical protein